MSENTNDKNQNAELIRKARRYALIACVVAFFLLPVINRFMRLSDIIIWTAIIGGLTWAAVRYRWFQRYQESQGQRVREHPLQASEPGQAGQSQSRAEADQRARAFSSPAVYTIRLPKDTKWQPNLAVSLVRELALYENIVLRITSSGGEIFWQVLDLAKPARDPGKIIKSIKGVYAQADVSEPQPYHDHNGQMPFYRRVEMFGQATPFLLALQDASAISKSGGDYLSIIANNMANLDPDESVSYLIYTAIADERVYKWSDRAIYKPKWGVGDIVLVVVSCFTIIGAIYAFVHVLQKSSGGRELRFSDADKLLDKINQVPLVRCHIVTEVNTPTEARLGHFDFRNAFLQFATTSQVLVPAESMRTDKVTNSMQNAQTSGLQQLLTLKQSSLFLPQLPANFTYNAWQKLKLDHRFSVLTVSELAALWHLPHEDMDDSDFAWIKGTQVVAPVEFRGKRPGVLFGMNRASGREWEIYIPHEERTHHALLIGKTGMGKTSTIHALIEDDIAAGRGVAVVDPLGGLVRRVLQHSIPPERENDVVILDIDYEFDEEGKKVRYPPPMNLLAHPQKASDEEFSDDVAAGQVMSVLTKIYGEGFETTEMAHSLTNALMTLMAENQPTLLDIERVFNDLQYREKLLERIENFVVARAWERFESRRNQVGEKMYPILRRLDMFYINPILLTLTCHPDSLDIAQLMSGNKIILVSLHADERKIPELQRMVLGATIISQIQMAALAGGITQPPYLLYVDEVHNFVTTSLDVIARQARQKGLGLCVATQYLKSLTNRTLDAFLGTIGTIGAFETDDADARLVSSYMKPGFDVSDLTNLGKHKMAISMRSAEGGRAAFSLDPAFAPPADETPECIERELYLRRKSVENYTPKTFGEVKAWLDEKYRPKKPPKNRGEFSDPV
ncbi:MAG: type IV secretion system DNA-binding domain-containing protein [Anaerolineae bacterium]|nr:type IV secretion system DNA-binding domain-containing protein [Anaerolineae bacterium]